MFRIGLFGGTFNPVHIAHIKLADLAVTSLHLDCCYWIPCRPWQKDPQELIRDEDRLALLQLALTEKKAMKVHTCDLDRGIPTYTVDTVQYFREQFASAQLFLLLGSDQWNNFHTWHNWQEILSLVTPVIFTRHNIAPTCHADVQHYMDTHKVSVKIIRCTLPNVSSSQIRQMIGKDGPFFDKLADNVLPRPVLEYIQQHSLYQCLEHRDKTN